MVTRVVLNPAELTETASALEDACGEYEAIGTRVYGCDCGCMPADVAALVDGVTAEVRAGLEGISYELGAQASDLADRAGVPQEDGFTAVGAAWGGPAIPDGGSVVEIGGYFDSLGLGSSEPFLVGIGSGFTSPDPEDGFSVDIGSGYTVGIGGGYVADIGGTYSTGTADGGYIADVGSGYTVGIGDGYTTTVGSSDDVPGSSLGVPHDFSFSSGLTLTSFSEADVDANARKLLGATS
jgi:hypothetical protein